MKVSDKYFDEIFDFLGQWDMASKCGLKITDVEGKKIVVVTELYQDNPGTSVTYAGGSLFKQICDKKGFDTNNVIYIECNPNTNSKLSFYDEEFFQVTFDNENGNFIHPKYTQLSKEEVKKYIPEF